MDRIITRPFRKPRKRVRDPRVVSRYHATRAGLACEWCHFRQGTEANHILHGSKKEDAAWNLVVICHACHQHPVTGFHGSRPAWTVEQALRQKMREGFLLPREAWAYLEEGVDAWPGTEQTADEQFAIAERLADALRRG